MRDFNTCITPMAESVKPWRQGVVKRMANHTMLQVPLRFQGAVCHKLGLNAQPPSRNSEMRFIHVIIAKKKGLLNFLKFLLGISQKEPSWQIFLTYASSPFLPPSSIPSGSPYNSTANSAWLYSSSSLFQTSIPFTVLLRTLSFPFCLFYRSYLCHNTRCNNYYPPLSSPIHSLSIPLISKIAICSQIVPLSFPFRFPCLFRFPHFS